MSEDLRMYVEVGFNVSYLIAVWALVAVMYLRREQVAPALRRQAALVMGAFALLALGDTGHVGFRVWAYALGSLESVWTVGGVSLGLVGLGALATAVTVTFFYVLVMQLWRERFKRRYGLFEYFLLAMAVVRLLLMLLPQNDWNSTVPPQPWSILRNLPLTILGLGAAYLILRDARAAGDSTYRNIGLSILVSYACYIPVILFVQVMPVIGMLMIPKTLAYLAVGFFAYRNLYQSNPQAQAVTAQAAD